MYKDYAFIWLQDVNYTFQEFLAGNINANHVRDIREEEDLGSRVSVFSIGKNKSDLKETRWINLVIL